MAQKMDLKIGSCFTRLRLQPIRLKAYLANRAFANETV